MDGVSSTSCPEFYRGTDRLAASGFHKLTETAIWLETQFVVGTGFEPDGLAFEVAGFYELQAEPAGSAPNIAGTSHNSPHRTNAVPSWRCIVGLASKVQDRTPDCPHLHNYGSVDSTGRHSRRTYSRLTKTC